MGGHKIGKQYNLCPFFFLTDTAPVKISLNTMEVDGDFGMHGINDSNQHLSDTAHHEQGIFMELQYYNY